MPTVRPDGNLPRPPPPKAISIVTPQEGAKLTSGFELKFLATGDQLRCVAALNDLKLEGD